MKLPRLTGLLACRGLLGCADSRLNPPSAPGGYNNGDAGVSDPDDGDVDEPPTDDDPPPPPIDRVRFVAIGDAGTGEAAQFEVGAAIADHCADFGCDFVLYLGDNFYPGGIESVDDPQLQTKFEAPYADIDVPFYVVLGNHDYGETALEQWRAPHEVQYTQYSDKWTMPDRYYAFVAEHVQFVALDTNAIMLDWTYGEQASFVDATLAASTSRWKIALGHHPYLSSGKHGNAGNYEGCSWLCPYVNGEYIVDFVESYLCGKVDLYLAGHDHNRQWQSPACGTEFVISGGGAKLTSFVDRDDNAMLFGDDVTPGFFWFDIQGDTLYGAAYDKHGAFQYQRTVTR